MDRHLNKTEKEFDSMAFDIEFDIKFSDFFSFIKYDRARPIRFLKRIIATRKKH